MAKTRGIKKYNISKYRLGELYNFCLQYNEWKEELKYNTHTMKGINLSDMPKGRNTISDPTAALTIRRIELSNKCHLIEQTAIETDEELHSYILKAVTEDLPYTYLSMVLGMPCGRDMYYELRKKFFWLLSMKR